MKLLRPIPVGAPGGGAGRRRLPRPCGRESLLELYESARAYDATWQSAKAQYDANLYRAEQAKAGILPAAGLGASVSRFELRQHRARDVETRAPIHDPDRHRSAPPSRCTGRPTSPPTSRASARSSWPQAQLTAASQDLIIRVSQAYFDVLAAQDTLALRAGAESRRGRAAGFGQAQFRGRHHDHHRHARGAGPLRPRRRPGNRGGERPARQEARARYAGRQARREAQSAGGAGGRAVAAARRRERLGAAGRGEQPRHPAGQDGGGGRPARNREGQGRPQADARPHGQLQRHAQPERNHHATAC